MPATTEQLDRYSSLVVVSYCSRVRWDVRGVTSGGAGEPGATAAPGAPGKVIGGNHVDMRPLTLVDTQQDRQEDREPGRQSCHAAALCALVRSCEQPRSPEFPRLRPTAANAAPPTLTHARYTSRDIRPNIPHQNQQ